MARRDTQAVTVTFNGRLYRYEYTPFYRGGQFCHYGVYQTKTTLNPDGTEDFVHTTPLRYRVQGADGRWQYPTLEQAREQAARLAERKAQSSQ